MDQKIKHNTEWTDTGVPGATPQKVGPLRLGDVVVQPGATVNVPNWERVSRSSAVQSWLRVGIISKVSGGVQVTAADETDPNSEEVQKQKLVDELAALGIKKTTRTSLDNLQAALDEAKGGNGGVQLPGFNPPPAS